MADTITEKISEKPKRGRPRVLADWQVAESHRWRPELKTDRSRQNHHYWERAIDVLIDDGRSRRTITLNRPYHALHIVPGVWRELHNFSSGVICLVLASATYDEDDYIRDYSCFLESKGPLAAGRTEASD